MKINERITAALHDCSDNTESQLIRYAYYAGRHTAAKQVCDVHAAKIKAMRTRADACRYHILANIVIGNGPDTIYHPDYAGDYIETFGQDGI